MQPLLRRTFQLLVVYAILVAALWVLAHRGLRQQTLEMMTRTAQLLGTQIASSLERETVRAVANGDSGSRLAVLDRLIEVVDGSNAVETVSFVGANGRVLVSDEVEDIGRYRSPPSEIFTEGSDPRLTVLSSTGVLSPRAYLLEIPFVDSGSVRGYFRIELSTVEFAGFYRSFHTQALLLATLGLLALGVLSFLLHLQVRRSEDAVVASLRRLAENEPREGDETGGRRRRDRDLQRTRKAVESVARVLDETRRARAEGERRWEKTAERIDVGLVAVDRGGAVAAVNPRASELLGLPEDLAAPGWEAAVARLLATVEGGGTPTVLEIETGRAEAPRRRRIRVDAQRVEGEVLFFLHDQDALDALDTDLRHAARLRSMMRLYLGVAHDLKAPINAMVLNLQLARRRVERFEGGDRPPAELDKDLEIVEKELGRLQRALERLLAQTAPETEERQRCDLVLILREIAELLEPQLRQQRIELTLELGDRPLLVDGNPDRLKQGILGIAVNGLEAIGREGRLGFELVGQDDAIRVLVHDDGPGIPEHLLPRIFEMRLTTKAGGNGIGLYVARSIFEEHDGSIAVRSTGRDGTTFEIRLPAAEETPIARAENIA